MFVTYPAMGHLGPVVSGLSGGLVARQALRAPPGSSLPRGTRTRLSHVTLKIRTKAEGRLAATPAGGSAGGKSIHALSPVRPIDNLVVANLLWHLEEIAIVFRVILRLFDVLSGKRAYDVAGLPQRQQRVLRNARLAVDTPVEKNPGSAMTGGFRVFAQPGHPEVFKIAIHLVARQASTPLAHDHFNCPHRFALRGNSSDSGRITQNAFPDGSSATHQRLIRRLLRAPWASRRATSRSLSSVSMSR